MLITYTFDNMSSQNHGYNSRSKKAANVTNTLYKIENNLRTSTSDLKDEIINLKEIITKNDNGNDNAIVQNDNAMLANKVFKLEYKIKNL